MTKKYETLGDINGALTQMKVDGVTRESIEYVLNRVYWEGVDNDRPISELVDDLEAILKGSA